MTIDELMRVSIEFNWIPGSEKHVVREDDSDMRTVSYVGYFDKHEVIIVLGNFPVEAMYHIYLNRELAKSVDGLPRNWKIRTKKQSK